jgi:S-adenosylmethionine:tRNA ribosyltransferase-isomerase
MKGIAGLKINDYKYELPQEKIALHPLPNRDESRLMVYKHGEISHNRFYDLASFLPETSFLFFNDTKVIPARLHFKKETGADIEIFLLSPVEPSAVLSETMQATDQSVWKCTIGNLKRWTGTTRLTKIIGETQLEASLVDKEQGMVRFTWNTKKSFAEIINRSGETPLPPYLKRKVEASDRERYQTIYSHHEGAVAAPTAGLHFTEKVFNNLNKKNIGHDFLTLHVSAGTFRPVKTEDVEAHVMHPEQLVITGKNIDNLLQLNRFIIAVGTTSMRTLESLYWFGAKLLKDKSSAFVIHQDDPYLFHTHLPSASKAFAAIKKYMDENGKDSIIGETSIFIKPGYPFKVCRGLITNFHQPASTLMLLVAAFAGNDWHKIYDEALKNDYRFLSYGDSSLLLP